MNKKIPVIIDCDTGLDDAIGLLVALKNERLDIKAVTVVAGNQTLDKTSMNTLQVLSYAGASVPVGIGFARPIVRELVTAGEVHGENGLGGLALPTPTLKASEYHAIDLMANIIRDSSEKITLIPIGPLTNIAMFLRRYPELIEKIESIALMGGAANGGNKTPAAEFNIYVDPEAAAIVFGSGIPITMAGLDVTSKAVVTSADVERIKHIGNKISTLVAGFLEFYLRYYSKVHEDGCHLHDPVAIYMVSDPDMIQTKSCHVEIELNGIHTLGSTVADFEDKLNLGKNVELAVDIDNKRFLDAIVEALKKYN